MHSKLRILLSCALVFLAAIFPLATIAAEHLSINADSVKFYGDRYLLEGDGNVNLLLDHQYHITGRTFSMDLRLNRFVIAGDVHVTGPGVALQGAGFADFFDSQRIYFVPLLDQPDRWTFESMDFAHPFKGREMPGDPFFLPDVSSARVTVKSTHAEIQPLTYVRFNPAQVLVLGVMTPLPSYAINFASNPDFRQNSLAGAIQDAPYDFFGDAHRLSTLHVRYDQTNKAYLSFEQHYVAKGGWVVASINPMTRPIKQYNVIGLGRIGSKDQVYGFFQAIGDQRAFTAPTTLSAFGNFQLTHVLRQSFVTLALNQSWDSLRAQPSTVDGAGIYYYNDRGHPWIPMHPFNGLLTWQGMDHPVGRLPLNFKLRSSFGWAHDNTYDHYSFGLTSFDQKIINSISYETVDATFYSKPIKLPGNAYLNLSFEKNRQWYSLPHYTDSENTNFSVSKTYGSTLAIYAGYAVNNLGDYWGSKQELYYPDLTYVSPIDGQTYATGFHGFATRRTLYASAVIQPSQNLTLNLLFSKNKDFPAPVPGVLGNPPYQAYGDLRVRINAHASLDISRGYNFQFGNQGWTPNFAIQVLP